ncbi:glycoside hydrolase family 2 protein [Kribbella sp. NPDC004536]|uniref:glycoside hydrolase family 2 protein n=1 Tax=Kribbella sp. NPDC004536 TaxID=3364106 RepID=UPI0036C4CAF2
MRNTINRDWRFVVGDPSGAERIDHDDSGWERVGLPHSFSIPYFQSTDFYTGPGWYRQTLVLTAEQLERRRVRLEFEAAFQQAKVYVNGVEAGTHRGGYTGFVVDTSELVRAGSNLIAVRVDNEWDPTLAPRAGEHVFSGGLYRDVWLEIVDEVHVAWNGVAISTPGLAEGAGRVQVEVEVENQAAEPFAGSVGITVLDPAGAPAGRAESAVQKFPPGVTRVVLTADPQDAVALWSPETPNLYSVTTTVQQADGIVRDELVTPFGFRYFGFDAEQGFSLNGRSRYLLGANVHQDQAGWGDAVTNGSIRRDLRLMKDAGFDFIRGSHYPHDPAFAATADELGLLVWSEGTFWGTGPAGGSAWGGSAYPTDESHWAAFDESCKAQLTEMILANRNHPSVIVWSVGNEAFFTDPETLPQVRRLLAELVELGRRLDPTRPIAVGGVQRGDLDRIGDLAGYNGDGAWLFEDPGIPNLVSEYGSTSTHRPGEYGPGWGDLTHRQQPTDGDPYPWRHPWRSGEVIWCGFDHGSIAGQFLGSMGIVDYARLPKRSWYWYRSTYRGIEPPAWPVAGPPAALSLTADKTVLESSDGTDDSHVVVTVLGVDGQHVAVDVPVTLTITSGPGEFATGSELTFDPDGPNPIREGQAAAFFRSYHAGSTVIVAEAEGLRSATLVIETTDGPPYEQSAQVRRTAPEVKAVTAPVSDFGTGNPVSATSHEAGHPPQDVNDGSTETWWQSAPGDAAPSVSVHLERVVRVEEVLVDLRLPAPGPIAVELVGADADWQQVGVLSAGQLGLTVAVEQGLESTTVRLRAAEPFESAAVFAVGNLTVRGSLS